MKNEMLTSAAVWFASFKNIEIISVDSSQNAVCVIDLTLRFSFRHGTSYILRNASGLISGSNYMCVNNILH